MKTKWDLKKLYSGHKSKNYINDIKNLKELNKTLKLKINSFINSIDNKSEINKNFSNIIKLLDRAHLLSSKLITFNVLNQSIDSNNTTASGALEKIKNILSDSTSSYISFFKSLNKINYKKIAEISPFVHDHLGFLDKKLASVKHLLSENEETLLSRVNNVATDSWVRLHNSLISNEFISFTVDDKKTDYSISMLRTLINSKSKKLRKNAYIKEIELSKKIAHPISECMNSLKGSSLVISKMRGFNSPLEQVLFNSQMDKQTLEALLHAIEKNLPKLQEYFIIKSKALKNNGALPYYDLFAPIDIDNKDFNFECARELIIENFHSFSKDFGNMAETAFKNNWIDAFPAPGKRGGAFCMNLSYIKESRVMLNFNNSFKSIITMAHELGHAYHNHCSTHLRSLCLGFPMPLAETASIFAENIVKKNLLKTADHNHKLMIIEADLCDMGQKIIDIYSRYLFETKVFKERKKEILTPEQLCNIMSDSQIKAYGNGLDQKYLHPYMWVNKPHYYGSDFYNFPYAFGILFSKGLYRMYNDEGSNFADKYKKFLGYTNINSVEKSAELMGIDVQSTDFWELSIKEYIKDIKLFKDYVEKTI